MNIALLSASNNVYSTRRIAEEAQILGHYIEQVDHTQCSILLRDGSSQIRYRGDDLSQAFDVIIPRIGNRVTRHGVAVVKQFELSGAFSCARSISIMRARNKARTLQLLVRKNIPVPNTIFSIDPDTVEAQIASIGGAPIIIKIQEGTHGVGVVLAETIKSAKSIIDTFYKMDTSIILQEYIAESKGEDVRIIVVGDKVIAGMKRTSTAEDFRSNLHQGGSTEKVQLSKKEEHMAIAAAKQLGLGVAGIDLIRSKKGPLVIEVNASPPGLRGIEATTGINVAKEIILYAERNFRSKRWK